MCVCSLQFTLVLRCLNWQCLFKVDTSCGEPGLIKHLEISDIEDVQQEPGSQGGIAYALRDFGHLHCTVWPRICLWSALAVSVGRCWGLWVKDKGFNQSRDAEMLEMQKISLQSSRLKSGADMDLDRRQSTGYEYLCHLQVLQWAFESTWKLFLRRPSSGWRSASRRSCLPPPSWRRGSGTG